MIPFNSNIRPINILIIPLDWGLGHATRCIPIINYLLSKNCNIIIASSGPQKKLLQTEFPSLKIIDIEGYHVRYAQKRVLLALFKQLIKINRAISLENKWLKKSIADHKVDWVISDNRYGCHSDVVPCTFITHQLLVKLPPLLTWAQPLLQNILYRHINKFSACWVPDLPDENRGLSGALGHPNFKPRIPVWYTGWLSRFTLPSNKASVKYKAIIILSGPEPQRTLLEGIITRQLARRTEKFILIRGLPGSVDNIELAGNISVFPHLSSPIMLEAVMESEYVIARCGYSTLMDMFTLQKKCIFIPTPGQTEQEYLAKTLSEKKMALVYSQPEFSLEKGLSDADKFHFQFPLYSPNNLLQMAVDHFFNTYFCKHEIEVPGN